MDSKFVPFSEIFINRLRRTKPFDMPVLHYHDGYELFYVIDGERDFFIGDSEYKLKKGEVLLINPFEMHFSFSAQNPVHDRYVLNFKEEHFDKILDAEELCEIKNMFGNRILMLDNEQQRYMLNLLTNIKNETESENSFLQKSARAGMVHMFAFLQTAKEKEIEAEKSDTVLNAVKYINENYDKEISLEEISEYCHFVPSYFCRSFKKTTGMTFLQYLNTMRVNKAHLLLTTTDKPIYQIAEECGFSSVAHMTRLFNKCYGFPPSRIERKGY